MPRPLQDQVVVVMGASSGIGYETAVELARHGAKLVVAARSDDGLQRLVESVQAIGGVAYPLVCDVARWDDVKRVADEAVARFGRVDTWFNNAGVSVYGMVADLTIDEIERVIQVDLMGVIYSCKAILPYMRQQGYGTIITTGSGLSARAVPLQAPYVAAKHAVKGFVDTMRMELDYENAGIDVTLILPASINTPFFDNARSKTGRAAAPIPPVYQPHAVAEAVVSAARSPRRQIYVGGPARLMAIGDALVPSVLDKIMNTAGNMIKTQQSDEPDDGRDNLHGSTVAPGVAASHWNTLTQPTSLYAKLVELHPNQQKLLLGAALLGAALWMRSRRNEQRDDRELFRYPVSARQYPDASPLGEVDDDYNGAYIPAT